MKYFEYIMAKEKEANKSSTDSEDQAEKETEVKKKDYLPERRKYEMLCRGEGLKMVKWSRLFSNVWNQLWQNNVKNLYVLWKQGSR